MPIRTGRAFLDSLRDDRQIWIDGERVTDVATDRRFAAAARSVAELYDMQHEPALLERMTYASPSSGDRVGLSFIQPRIDRGADPPARNGENLDGRDLWHVRPQSGFPEHHPDRLRFRAPGVRQFRREPVELLPVCARERHRYDAYLGQSAGRSLAPGGETGQGPGRQDRQGDGCRDRGDRRTNGVDAVRLRQRYLGDAVHLPREHAGSCTVRLRILHPGRDQWAALHMPSIRCASRCRLADGLSAVITAGRNRRHGCVR